MRVAQQARRVAGGDGGLKRKVDEFGLQITGGFSEAMDLEKEALTKACVDMDQKVVVNFYPKCPQPDLTLGLSPHSDPGGMTFLLPDHNVPGLQVSKNGGWITVKPAPHAFIVNIGDQIQVLTLIFCARFFHSLLLKTILK